MSDQDKFDELTGKCPFDLRTEPFAWTKWMRDEGYKARMPGDLLHSYIIDNIAGASDGLASLVGPAKAFVPDGREEMNGKPYMRDAKGSMVPVELVKAQDQLEDETVRKIIGYAKGLNGQIARFKEHTYRDLGDFEALLFQEYEITRGGKKGNKTFLSYDGQFKVQVQVQDYIAFGPQLQIAKTLIDECLNEWAATSSPEIRAIVTRAFNTDKEGQVNKNELFMLQKLEITDKRWQKAMKAINDAQRVIGSKMYVRCYERPTPEAKFQAITIDLAKA